MLHIDFSIFLFKTVHECSSLNWLNVGDSLNSCGIMLLRQAEIEHLWGSNFRSHLFCTEHVWQQDCSWA